MEGVEWEFVGPGTCEMCQSMVGTTSDSPIGALHENCQCSSVPRCDNRHVVSGSSTRYGEGGRCFIFNAEITVTCWDGTEIGMTVPIDMGCEEYEDVFEAIEEAAADAAEALKEGCPDCSPPLVS